MLGVYINTIKTIVNFQILIFNQLFSNYKFTSKLKEADNRQLIYVSKILYMAMLFERIVNSCSVY